MPEQRAKFENIGFVHLADAFSREEAQKMENTLWEALKTLYGADRSDSSTWKIEHVSGLQSLKTDPVFDAIGSPRVIDAIDDLLGKNQWAKPTQWGQFLVNFPKIAVWSVPTGWHSDFEFDAPAKPLQGVLLFAFLADVPPQSGGTAILTRSHHAIARFIEKQPTKFRAKMKTVRKAFFASDPWLVELDAPSEKPDRIARFMEAPHRIEGIPLQVEELTGRAGDVVLGHPWLFHAAAPNCGNYPRFMRVQRVRRNK